MSAQRRLASLDCSQSQNWKRSSLGMCSTPFGVIGLFTHRLLPLRSASNVLNAVWRHWIVHSAVGVEHLAEHVVLNAVWRHWIVHNPVRSVCVRWAQCSTPFGVIGLFTRRVQDHAARGHRAQRRLASFDCSHANARSGDRASVGAQRRLASLDCSHEPSAR